MDALIATSIIGVFTAIFIAYFIYKCCQKKLAVIQINIVDYKQINFYDEIVLIVQQKVYKKIKLKEKTENIKFFGFYNKGIIKCELILSNKTNQKKKNFKINIYKNYLNIINIKANNIENIYYNIEIIFYLESEQNKIILPDFFKSTNHNYKKRKRLLICNINDDEITKIIKDNINNKDMQEKAIKKIRNNFNKPLLLNIYINDYKSNILIFVEEDEYLIVPSKDEKTLFQNFNSEISKNIFNTEGVIKICEMYKSKLVEKKKIFGKEITDLNSNKNINIYFSFINQGINALFDNYIIKSNFSDYSFILGYILFYLYICKDKLDNQILGAFYFCLFTLYKKGYSYKDLIRIAVSYILFILNDHKISDIKLVQDLGVDNPYRKGFIFFRNIILNLNEDSDLILYIYKQFQVVDLN